MDSDPAVRPHAERLLAGGAPGSAAFAECDLRDVAGVLRAAAATIDLSRPVAVLLLIVLHLVSDADDPRGIVWELMGGLASGSYLVISHPASDVRPAAMAEMARRVNARLGAARGTMRDRDQVAALFDGLAMVEPGLVQPQRWRPDGVTDQAEVTAWCGVARKEEG